MRNSFILICFLLTTILSLNVSSSLAQDYANVNVDLCEGQTFHIRHKVVTTAGVYYDTLVAKSGNDSIIRYVVTFHSYYLFNDTVSICEGDSYLFEDHQYSEEGDYYANYKAVGGCDSIRHLRLIVNPTYRTNIDTTVCGSLFNFRGKPYMQSGDYYDTLTTKAGCDSIIRLSLTLVQIPVTHIILDACEGDSVWIGDRYLPAIGAYYDTLLSYQGCDSVIRYTFNLHKAYLFEHSETICQGETYTFFDRVLTSPGDYFERFKTTQGCDSVYHLTLSLSTRHYFIIDTVVCGNTCVFHNRTFTQSGTYYDTISSPAGCDSVFQLNLTITPAVFTNIDMDVCEGDSVWIRDRYLPARGLYFDTLVAKSGCDSVIRYRFNVYPSYTFHNVATICEGDSFLFCGQYLSTPGHFIHSFQTIHGCDSTYHLDLTVNPVFRFVVDTALCAKTFVFHNHTYTESGTYYDRVQSETGCDSVYQLNLRLYKPSPVIDVNVSLCHGDSFFLRGKQIPTSSFYYDSLLDSHGCDSIVRYIFNFHPVFDIYDTVSICQGDYYDFGGSRVTEAGDYTLSYKTIAGCDSTIHLKLSTRPSYLTVFDTTLCANHFVYNHHTYTESGTYYDTIQTLAGCDSVLQLNLTLNKLSLVTDVNISLCQGDSFFIRGKQIPTTTIYYDTLLNKDGCDSIVRYIFNVLPVFDIYDTAVICKGDYYEFGTRHLTEAGDYIIEYQTVAGCDSTLHLHLSTREAHYYELDTTLCADYFIFNNHTYTESGIYTDTISTTQGCDSILRLNLTLYHLIPVTDIPVTICHGDSFSIAGSDISLPGIYYDSLLSTHGCDSVIRYIINVLPTYQFYDTVSICDYEKYVFQGDTISASGDYHKHYTAINNCDSSYHLHLTVNPSYYFVVDTIACGHTFRFQERDYTESGTYDHLYHTVNGCDSLYRLILRLNKPKVTDIHLDVCEGDSMYISGKNVPARGIYNDTLYSSDGCDSIVRYIFNVHNSFEFYETATICSNEKYYFFGDSLTNQGDYTKVFKTAWDCDSVYHLHLDVLDSYLFIIDTIACGNTFRFRNKDYVASGRYVDSLLTVDGCDSVYILNLTLHPNVLIDIHLDVCDGDSMYISGKLVPARGIYCDTLLTTLGCDSVVRYIFDIHNNFEFYQIENICPGDTFMFFGRPLTETGDYTETFKTAFGCDSIYHLHLEVGQSYIFVTDTVACGHTFRFRNKDYTESGSYIDSLKSRSGCDSVYILNLTLHKPSPITEFNISLCEGDSFFIRGKQIPTTTVYYDSLLNVHGCDSVVKYIFNVKPTYDIYDSVHICKGDYYDFDGRKLTEDGDYYVTYQTVAGCDSTIHLHLVTDSVHYIELDTTVCGNFFVFNNHSYTASGTYVDTISTTHGCDSILTLNLTLYPTIPVTDVTVTVCQGDSFSISGKRAYAPGIYVDTLRSAHGCDSIVRFIVNVLPTYHFYDTVTICDYEAYTSHGTTLTDAGDYHWTFRTQQGCDSAYHLHLVVNPSYLFVTDTIACGHSFRFQERDYTESGTYEHSFKTVNGCDSIYRLILRLNKPVVTDIHLDVCDGDSMYISGKNIPARGIYCDTLLTSDGCDSVVRYIFDVHNSFEFYQTATICSNEKYYFFGDSLYNEGDYTKVFKTAKYGCDSIYHLHLTVLDSYLFIIDTIACGNTFRFRNKDYVASGRYVDSLLTVEGCDSVYILDLTLYHHKITDIHVDVCDGDSFYFNGRYIPARGVYCDTLMTFEGCDSIVRYIFDIHNTFEIYQNEHICTNDTFYFFGRALTETGDYYENFKTAYGCDSIYHLHLEVGDAYIFVTDTILCGRTFRFRNKDYTESGHYVDTVRTRLGCDSIYILNLRLDTAVVTDVNMYVCAGDSVYIGTTLVPAIGVYNDTLRTANGCDSIVRYIFNVRATFDYYETAEICPGDVYDFHGFSFSEAGDHTLTFRTAEGCDSVYHLHLIVNPSYLFVVDTIVCGYSLNFNGKFYDKSGTYYDNYVTTKGCDSIYKIILKIFEPQFTDYALDVCNDETVVIRGKVVPVGGVYNDTIYLPDGCFAIDRYTFNIHSNFEIFDTAHICLSDAITFDGRTISSPGDYVAFYRTVYGCDSIVHLHLSVHETYYRVIDTTTCEDVPFYINNIQVLQSGTYQTNYKTRWGCDSTVIFNLTINDTILNEIYDTICEGDVFYFKNRPLTETGVYSDTTFTVHGCRQVDRVHLMVGHKYIIERHINVCQNELPIVYQGITVTTGTRYTQTNYTTLGCDSILWLYVHVYPAPHTYDTVYNCSGGVYHWNDSVLTKPGDYTVKLRSALGCDSIVNLHYDTLPPIRVTNAKICKGDAYEFRKNHYTIGGTYDVIAPASGINCDTIYRLILAVDTSAKYTERVVDTCNVTGFMFAGRYLTENGIYYDTTLTSTGCYNITKLTLRLGYDVLVSRLFDICEGQSVTFNGHRFTTDTLYRDTSISSAGCDSVYEVIVRVNPVYTVTDATLHVCGSNDSVFYMGGWYKPGSYYALDSTSTPPCYDRHGFVVVNDSFYHDTTVVICENKTPYVHPYTGRRFSKTDVYIDSFRTALTQCDSIYRLNLIVKPVPSTHIYDTICEGESYFFGKHYYQTDVTVSDTLVAANSCDSISTLHLKLIHNHDTTVKYICQGDYYTWPVSGLSYNNPGYYHYVDTTTPRCPAYHVLSLVMVPPVNVTRADIDYVCADDPTYHVMLTMPASASTPNTVSVVYDQDAHDAGFEDYTAAFTGVSFSLPMPTGYQRTGDRLDYVRPGYYNVRFRFNNGVCDSLLTEVNTAVEVRYPSFVLEQNWNDVVAVTRFNHHDGRQNDDSYRFSRFEWYLDGNLVNDAHKSYLYTENFSLEGHVVHARLTRIGENTGVFTCPLYIVHMDETGKYPILDGPQNMLRQQSPYTSFSANEAGTYTIYTVSGQLVSTGDFEADVEVNLSFPPIQGYYILHVETQHMRENYKILVY